MIKLHRVKALHSYATVGGVISKGDNLYISTDPTVDNLHLLFNLEGERAGAVSTEEYTGKQIKEMFKQTDNREYMTEKQALKKGKLSCYERMYDYPSYLEGWTDALHWIRTERAEE